MALSAAKSNHDAAKHITKELSAYLRELASVLDEPGLELGIAALDGNESESLQDFLDSIESNSIDNKRISQSQSEACLNIASIAAKQGQIPLSARALKVALQRGPRISLLSRIRG